MSDFLFCIFSNNTVVLYMNERIIDVSIQPSFTNTKKMYFVRVTVNEHSDIINFIPKMAGIQVPNS